MNLKHKVNKVFIANILSKILIGLVILLLIFTLFGRINPARISGKTDSSISLLQSAFYFRTSTSQIVSLGEASLEEEDNPFAMFESDEEVSLEDFYANLAAMMNEESEDLLEESDGEEYSDDYYDDSEVPAEKIEITKYSKLWNEFKENHPEIAKVISFNHIAALLTCCFIFLCIIGLYLSLGKGFIKKIGYVLLAAGALLTSLSLLNFKKSYTDLSFVFDSIDVEPVEPFGIAFFAVTSAIILILAVILFFIDRSEEKEVATADKKETLLSNFSVTPFQITYRVLALFLFILMFIPGANPARICENISRNVSLFTSGFAYGTYTKNIERFLLRGWLPSYVMRIAWVSSLLSCLGIFAIGIGACMSVGNNKLKRYAHFSLLGGSSVVFVSMFGIIHSYNLMAASSYSDRLQPLEPADTIIIFVVSILIILSTIISFGNTPKPEADEKCHIDESLQLFLMLLPFLILVFLFSYLPLWGWRYAFFDYKAGDVLSLDNWVGLKWFKMPFENAATRADIVRVLRNTLAMSGLGILTSWCPMFFAIFLAEIKNTGVRRVVQTLTTIPNFISWVLVYAIAFCIFGTEGFISGLMVKWGVWDQGKNMLMGNHFIWIKMLLWGMWKGLGWSAIMYIAAISGIDQELYEAATVDGAGRFQKMIHITLPELIPTYVVLLILSVSNILSNGMDQYLVFKNSTNKAPIEVLDLYVYQLTFGAGTSGNIPFSTVVSMTKSLISVILLFATNKISKWVRGTSIF